MNISNSKGITVVTGTDGNDSIVNSGNYVTLNAMGGNDSIVNSGNYVTLNAMGGNDTINSSGFNAIINGGSGNDTIKNNSIYATIRGGAGNDFISLSTTLRENNSLIIYNAGDGNDYIKNFGRISTLSIADTGYVTTANGNDEIVYVEDGSKIILKGVTSARIRGNEGNFVSSTFDNKKNGILLVGSDSNNRITNSGKDVTILTNGGKDSVTNQGQNAKIGGGADNDSIWSNGLNGSLDGGAGNDIIQNTGSNSTIKGGEGNDSIFIYDGSSTIDAGEDDDFVSITGGSNLSINGGLGNDGIHNHSFGALLEGADGNDYLGNAGSNVSLNGGMGNDTISNTGGNVSIDGGAGNDTIQNAGSNSTVTGGAGNNSISNSGSGSEVNGGEGNDFIYNAGSLLSRNDSTINALGGDDTIENKASTVSINAGSGNDSIKNNSSFATIRGGAGDDSISLSTVWENSLIIYNAGDGNDYIENFDIMSTLSIADTGYVTTANGNDEIVYVEDGSKITLKGVTSARISGNEGTFVSSTFDNKKNEILLVGGDSNNRITNSGKDVTILTNGGKDSVNNQGQNVKIGGGADNDSIWSNGSNGSLDGGAGNDIIQNTGSNSTVTGGDGNDSISNDAQNVTVDGGAGNDTIQNAGSNSTVTGGAGNDSISNSGSGSKVNGGEGNDTIRSNAENVTVEGGAGNDIIYLNDKANNLVQYTLGDGNDTIYGFNDTSTLDIGDGTSASLVRRGNDMVVTYDESEILLVGAENLSKVNVRGMRDEILNVTNTADNTSIVGGSFDDKIINQGKNVTIFAQGGSDIIQSTGENVTIHAGTENDRITVEGGNKNLINGDAGNDSIDNISSKNVTINAGADNDFIQNKNTDSNNVIILGGEGNDSISNVASTVTIDAGAGNDTIFNDGTYNVSIVGGAGNDTIRNNSAQNLTIEGGKGDDSILNVGNNALIKYTSGDGNDIINGFKSDSTLSIAGGIASTAKRGRDLIVTVGGGKITLAGAGNLSTVNIVETPVNIHNSAVKRYFGGTNANDTIINTGEEVTVQALKGNDSLNNNAKNVSIDGGEGDDNISNTGTYATLNAQGGNDTIYNNSFSSNSRAGAGNDSVFTHGRDNRIYGISGKNTIENYSNSDGTSLIGGTDNDSIKNSSDKVMIWGQKGNDTIFSNGTSNKIFGDEGDDLISIEGSYKNEITGGAGNDTINLDWSSNKAIVRYSKGDGNDVITGFNATSTLQLGSGNEFYSKSTEGDDVIVNFGEGNITLKGAATLGRLHINGFTTLNANNTLNGAALIGDRLDDTVKNSANRITISTFAGNDTIENSGSRVTIDGGADNDSIFSNDGNNVSMDAGAGDDSIYNNEGNFVSIVAGNGKNSISNINSNFASIVSDKDPDYISDTNGKNNTIDAGDGLNTVISSGGFRNVITGGNDIDSISVTNSNNTTINTQYGADIISVNGGFRNVIVGGGSVDTIYIPSSEGALIKHNKGEGSDVIYGFNETSTLQLGDGTDTYDRFVIDNNVIIHKAIEEEIKLIDAKNLPFVNIIGVAKRNLGIKVENVNKNILVNGTDADDSLGNAGANSTLLGHTGNDTISNNANSAVLDGGAGNDYLHSAGEYVNINGGEGDDTIRYRQYGNTKTTIEGGTGNDSIYNNSYDVTINAGVGDDTISLLSNSGKAMIQYTEGDGNDLITGFKSTDTLGVFADDFWFRNFGNDIIVTIDKMVKNRLRYIGRITLQGAASLKTVNIIRDEREFPVSLNNANNDTLLVGTSLKDTIINSGSYVTISAQGGNDSISNSGNNSSIDASAGDDTITNRGTNVTINGDAGRDYILNDTGFYTSIVGGEGSDFITVVSSSQVTVNAGKADDQISIRGNDEIFIEYNAGDGNDKIYGFDDMATLNVVQTEFTSATTGNDIVITVGKDKITLDGAATLSNPHIINGTQATFTVKNGAVTCASDLPENIIKDAYQFNKDSSTLSLSSALQNYTVNVKAEDAGKVKWHYGTANLVSGSTLEYKLDDGKNTAKLTSKNYGDEITFDEDTTFNFGRIEAEALKNSTVTTKGAKRISFENNSSANVMVPRGYQVDVSASNIMINDFPINAHNGSGTVTVERRGMTFEGYGVQFVDLEVAKEGYFGKLAPMTINYNSNDETYTIYNGSSVKTLSNDFTKLTFDFKDDAKNSTSNDDKYSYYKINDVAIALAKTDDELETIEVNGSTFKVQDKEIDVENIGRITIDEQITFNGTQIDFDGVKTTYTQNKPVIYSLDGKEITISDAASITTGDEVKTFKCEAGTYTINGRTFETSADLTFTADTNEIKIPLRDANAEVYFDGVKVSGVSNGGEIVFDLASNKINIPDGANLNITSPEAAKLNLAAGNYTIDGKKISSDTALEITADKDNIKVPLSAKPVTINGAAITGTGEATIDNTNDLFCSVLLPNGALVKNLSGSIYQLTGKDSIAYFGDTNKKVQLTEDGTTYIEYYKENTISVGINRFMFETVEIKGSDTWTIETAGTSGIDKIAGVKNGATISTSTEYVDAGDLRFEVETSGAGTFNIAGQTITSTAKNTYVVYGNSNGEIKVAAQGEEYADDDSEAAGKTYNFNTAGDYTVNGITFNATANSKAQTITRGVEFDLSSGTFQYDGLTLSGGGAAQINRYNAKLVSLTDGAKVSGDDETKYQNRQFEIVGAVELIGKKFETNEQIRCGLINVKDTIDNEPITLRGFVVDDKYVQIQDDCYESVKVVDKKISSIEGVKTSAEITGNGLPNASIVTKQSGEFKIHDNTYKISDDSDGVTFVMDSRGNISEINGLTGSVEGNFENAIKVNGKAIRLTGASSIKVASDGEKITGISNVAGDSVTTGGKTYRKNVRVYELGGVEKLTTSADGTIIFSGNKFEMSAGKTFTLDNSGNVSGIEQAQVDSNNTSADVAETEASTSPLVEENFATITLSTTDNLDEVIGDFSEGLTVNGVFVKVTDSTNFVVKNDDQNVYIETTAPDTFTINNKTFETYTDKTIFKLDASGNVSEIVTDKFYLYPEENAYLIEGDFSDEVIFNGKKFRVTGTNDTTILVGEGTLIGVELARNSVEVVESGGADEIVITRGGNITIGSRTFTTSDDFEGIMKLNSNGEVEKIENFIGTLSGNLSGLDIEGNTINSGDSFSVIGDGEKITALENLKNGTLTGNLDAITLNGEKISLDDLDEATLTITDGELKTPEEPSDEPSVNPSDTEEEFLDKLVKEISDVVTVNADNRNVTLKGGEAAIVEDTSAKVNVTASKGRDTIYTAGSNVNIDLKAGGATEIFAAQGRMTVTGYNSATGSGFHTDYADIFTAIDKGDIVFNNGKLTIGSAVIIDDDGNNTVNFFNTNGELQKVGGAFEDESLNLSKEKANLILTANKYSTLTAGAGSDSIFAFEGSFVDGGAGNNYIEIEERSANADGVAIAMRNGKSKVANFKAGFDDTSDRVFFGVNDVIDFKFDGSDLKVYNGNEMRGVLSNVASGADFVNILTADNNSAPKVAVAQKGAVITVENELADLYVGEKSGVDFTNYAENLFVNLGSENLSVGGGEVLFSGINQVTVGSGQNTLISSSANETLTSNGTTEYIFDKGNGRDVIQNFNFDGDKINVGTNAVTNVRIDKAGGVRMQISGDGWLTLENAQGKNFKINNFVAVADENLTYNAEANYFAATAQNATLTVGESAEIWLDGSHGKTFSGDIRNLDASTAQGKTSLAGNDLDNRIFAGQGDASLWGGSGGDDLLVGGAGKNTFYYLQGNGSDTIASAHDGDIVYLSTVTLEQISGTSITADAVSINFTDGGSLQVNSNANVTYQLADGSKFSANHAQSNWIAY